MGRKITLKLVIVYLATVVSMFFLLNAVGRKKIQRSLIENREKTMSEEASQIATEYGNASSLEIRRAIQSVDRCLQMRVLLTNTAGTVVVDTRSTEPFDLAQALPDFSNEFHENIVVIPLSKEPILFVCEPILLDYSVRGYVCLVVSMESIYRDTIFYVDTINVFILLFSAILLLVFVLIYLIAVWPVAVIKKTAIEYARKNYKYVCDRKLLDEYRDISEAMRVTAGEVERLEEYQKKFVGNVSHDFRSPLTSIKGYIEAIKDGTIPIEAANRYLDIILFETERLTKLTEDLLSLSRMDNQVELELTSFDIIAVIRKTLATFEGTCTKKKITFNLEFCDKDVYITADLGRIQQVLYNLIDNAIKFSNQDSSIFISVNTKGSKALISVKDTGIGIPKDAQKKIWERFYKSDLSRGKDKKGTGLGLAIVKDIIDAHGENISVVSTEGVGTEFLFSMPLAEAL